MTDDDGLTETQRAFLSAQYNREAFEDMSVSDISRLDMATYAALTGRQTPTQAVIQAADVEPPGQPRQAPEAAQAAPQPPAPEPQGVDVTSLSMEQYAALRGQLGMGRAREYGRGALDGGSTADWIAAARVKSGRSGWQGGNVVESPRLERRYAREEQPPMYGSAAERFTTPGNSFGS